MKAPEPKPSGQRNKPYVYPTGLTQKELYEQLHGDPESVYGKGSHGGGTQDFLKGCESLLDIGAGRSFYAQQMKDELKLKRAVVTDISNAACIYQLGKGMMALQCDVLEGLPFGEDEFDAVTAFDCLEHLPKDGLRFVLKEMRRVAKKVMVITVPEIQANGRGPGGEVLHLTVEPLQWWSRYIQKVLGKEPALYRHIQRYRGGNKNRPRYSFCFVVRL
jgi:ubiquinone/menaquinone biosynthesis C-methylase UbiE